MLFSAGIFSHCRTYILWTQNGCAFSLSSCPNSFLALSLSFPRSLSLFLPYSLALSSPLSLSLSCSLSLTLSLAWAHTHTHTPIRWHRSFLYGCILARLISHFPHCAAARMFANTQTHCISCGSRFSLNVREIQLLLVHGPQRLPYFARYFFAFTQNKHTSCFHIRNIVYLEGNGTQATTKAEIIHILRVVFGALRCRWWK